MAESVLSRAMNKPVRRGRIIATVLVLAVIVGVVSVPARCTPDYRDARRSEGEQMLGSFTLLVRVAHEKTDARPRTLTGKLEEGGCGVGEAELSGKYFMVAREITWLPDGKAQLQCSSRFEGFSDGTGTLTFDLKGGDGVLTWTDD